MKHHIVILLFLFLRTASALLGLCAPGNTLSTTRPTFFSITKLDASSVADASFSSSFNDRMRGILLKESNKLKRKSNNNKSNRRPKNLMLVKTLQEYKEVLQSDREKIIVVRFFAKWCKACKAIEPSFHRLARINPDITFVDVPVTEANADLHQGLGVPSLPFGHIYYPDGGLVEELKMSKKHFSNFKEILESYIENGCAINESDNDALSMTIER